MSKKWMVIYKDKKNHIASVPLSRERADACLEFADAKYLVKIIKVKK